MTLRATSNVNECDQYEPEWLDVKFLARVDKAPNLDCHWYHLVAFPAALRNVEVEVDKVFVLGER